MADAHNREAATMEIAAIARERDRLQIERDALIRDRAALARERNTLARERDIYRTERDLLIEQRQGLEKHLFVPPGHYYSPIVNVDELRDPFGDGGPPLPTDVRPDLGGHVQLWRSFEPYFARLPCLTGASNRYNDRNDNSSFPVADAITLQAMVATVRPRRYVEVGSGFSSVAMLDAVDAFCAQAPDITLVEPYPDLVRSLLRPGDEARISIVPSGVQQATLAIFEALQDGDILFIDSTHVMKTGSDVNHELFEILPRLQRGVYVHFHDIFWPFEYPRDWIFDVKRSWNELYGLRAFLAGQTAFQIVFFNDFFREAAPAEARALCAEFFRYRPGSLWLRKT